MSLDKLRKALVEAVVWRVYFEIVVNILLLPYCRRMPHTMHQLMLSLRPIWRSAHDPEASKTRIASHTWSPYIFLMKLERQIVWNVRFAEDAPGDEEKKLQIWKNRRTRLCWRYRTVSAHVRIHPTRWRQQRWMTTSRWLMIKSRRPSLSERAMLFCFTGSIVTKYA